MTEHPRKLLRGYGWKITRNNKCSHPVLRPERNPCTVREAIKIHKKWLREQQCTCNPRSTEPRIAKGEGAPKPDAAATVQEWTPEYVGSLVGGTFNGAWRIAEAHNAELRSQEYGTPELARRVSDLTLENDQLYSRASKAEAALRSQQQDTDAALARYQVIKCPFCDKTHTHYIDAAKEPIREIEPWLDPYVEYCKDEDRP